ncbi:MAG: hypothetical protein AAGA53_16445, partial [Pseudomonadota bacterium]
GDLRHTLRRSLLETAGAESGKLSTNPNSNTAETVSRPYAFDGYGRSASCKNTQRWYRSMVMQPASERSMG